MDKYSVDETFELILLRSTVFVYQKSQQMKDKAYTRKT